jgi:hypothetical protein
MTQRTAMKKGEEEGTGKRDDFKKKMSKEYTNSG